MKIKETIMIAESATNVKIATRNFQIFFPVINELVTKRHHKQIQLAAPTFLELLGRKKREKCVLDPDGSGN